MAKLEKAEPASEKSGIIGHIGSRFGHLMQLSSGMSANMPDFPVQGKSFPAQEKSYPVQGKSKPVSGKCYPVLEK